MLENLLLSTLLRCVVVPLSLRVRGLNVSESRSTLPPIFCTPSMAQFILKTNVATDEATPTDMIAHETHVMLLSRSRDITSRT